MTTKPAIRNYLSSPLFFCTHCPRGTLRRCVKPHRKGTLNVELRLGLVTQGGFVYSIQTHCEPARAPRHRKAPTPRR